MFAPKIRESPEEALASLNIQIVKSLGHGQYGKLSLYFLFIMYSVYLVMFHGNQYAAKVIPTMKLTGGDEQIVKLAQQPNQSPYLCYLKFTSYSKNHDYMCLLMEYCNLGDIEGLITATEEPIPWFSAGIIIFSILHGLEFIHRNGLLHRDIKAENIMLHYSQDFGKVIPKIADFGLMREGSNAQMAMTQCGTPLYMAPELYDESPEYTASVDMWAIGVLFYRLLSKRWPFNSSHFMGLLNLVKQPHPRITVDLPISCHDLIDGLLHKDPLRRLTAAQALQHQFFMDVGVYRSNQGLGTADMGLMEYRFISNSNVDFPQPPLQQSQQPSSMPVPPPTAAESLYASTTNSTQPVGNGMPLNIQTARSPYNIVRLDGGTIAQNGQPQTSNISSVLFSYPPVPQHQSSPPQNSPTPSAQPQTSDNTNLLFSYRPVPQHQSPPPQKSPTPSAQPPPTQNSVPPPAPLSSATVGKTLNLSKFDRIKDQRKQKEEEAAREEEERDRLAAEEQKKREEEQIRIRELEAQQQLLHQARNEEPPDTNCDQCEQDVIGEVEKDVVVKTKKQMKEEEKERKKRENEEKKMRERAQKQQKEEEEKREKERKKAEKQQKEEEEKREKERKKAEERQNAEDKKREKERLKTESKMREKEKKRAEEEEKQRKNKTSFSRFPNTPPLLDERDDCYKPAEFDHPTQIEEAPHSSERERKRKIERSEEQEAEIQMRKTRKLRRFQEAAIQQKNSSAKQLTFSIDFHPPLIPSNDEQRTMNVNDALAPRNPNHMSDEDRDRENRCQQLFQQNDDKMF